MSKGAELKPTITGDLPVDTVAVNAKGGSYSAIFKRSLRGGLGEASTWFGANMEFEPGISCVLMAPGRLDPSGKAKRQRQFRVKRVSNHRYIVDFDSEEEAVMHPVVKSVLSILEELVKTGKLAVDGAEEAQIALDKTLADSKKRIAAAEKKRRPGSR